MLRVSDNDFSYFVGDSLSRHAAAPIKAAVAALARMGDGARARARRAPR